MENCTDPPLKLNLPKKEVKLKKQKPNIAYDFLIENQEELARRMDGMVLDRQGLSPNMMQAFNLFREKRDAIYQVYQNFELIDESYEKQAIDYLDSFYEIINSPVRANREILDGCRQEN